MEILTKQEDFFPTDPPHGMKDFQFDELTKKQREHLNNFKMKTIRENHRYLKEHPEIKTVVKLLFHAVLKERPNIKVCDFFAKYVIKNYGLLSTILVQRASEPTASIKTVIIDDSKENIISKSDTKQTSSQVTIKQVETVVYRRHLSSGKYETNLSYFIVK